MKPYSWYELRPLEPWEVQAESKVSGEGSDFLVVIFSIGGLAASERVFQLGLVFRRLTLFFAGA